VPIRMDNGVKYSKNEVRDQSPALIGEVKNARSFVHTSSVKLKRVYERHYRLLKLCTISAKRMNQHGTLLE
jgi:hypothetical protein